MVERFEETEGENARALAEFRAEIEAIKNTDMKRGTVHLENVNTDELTAADLAIWKKVKDGSITREEYEDFSPPFGTAENESRKLFRFFIANKAAVIFSERGMRERGEEDEV